MSRASTPHKRRARGYTMVEVMVAMGVLAVGATGVIAMQRTVQIGNTNARALATANAIAQSWVERLRLDAIQWNNPVSGAPDIGDTQWLKSAAPNSAWFSPVEVESSAATGPAGSPDADILGADIFPGDAAAPAFCTHMRLTPLYGGLIRAEVRVVWIRGVRQIDCVNLVPGAVDTDPTATNPVGYGAVYVTTAILANVTQS